MPCATVFPVADRAPLAQLAEQRTLNPRVRGSSPWRRTPHLLYQGIFGVLDARCRSLTPFTHTICRRARSVPQDRQARPQRSLPGSARRRRDAVGTSPDMSRTNRDWMVRSARRRAVSGPALVKRARRDVGLPSGQRVVVDAKVARELAGAHTGDLTERPDLRGCPQWYIWAVRADHDRTCRSGQTAVRDGVETSPIQGNGRYGQRLGGRIGLTRPMVLRGMRSPSTIRSSTLMLLTVRPADLSDTSLCDCPVRAAIFLWLTPGPLQRGVEPGDVAFGQDAAHVGSQLEHGRADGRGRVHRGHVGLLSAWSEPGDRGSFVRRSPRPWRDRRGRRGCYRGW